MKVKVLTGFSGPRGSFSEGDVIDLPKGVDWLKAGLVVKVAKRRPKRRPAQARKDVSDK